MRLNDFINNTRGKYVNVSGWAKNQCTSLVQSYIIQCLGKPKLTWGHAKDFDENLVSQGIGKKVSKGQYGDIVVFNRNLYGHVAIFIDDKTMYDQYDGKKAGYVKIQSNPVFIRPNVKVEPYFVEGNYQFEKTKYVRLSAKVGGNKIKTKELMKLVRDLCISDINGYAKTKKGSIWKLDKFVFDSNYNIWGRRKGVNTDLWICVNDSTGNQATRV